MQPAYEPLVSTIPGLVTKGRYLDDPDAAEIVIGSVMGVKKTATFCGIIVIMSTIAGMPYGAMVG